MTWLPHFSLHRPITSIMVFLAMCVLGVIAWLRIPLELFPGNFSGTTLWVWVPCGDSAPRESESQVLRPIEDRLSDIESLKQIRASARSGSVNFELEFHRSISMDNAYNAVVDRLERAKVDLPEDADQYYVFKWDSNDAPIVYAGVGIDGDVETQYTLMENVVKRRLSRIDGVGEVDAWGTDPKRVFIDFSRNDLMSSRMGIFEVIQNLRADNFQQPSGRFVEDGKVHYLRSIAKYDTLDDLLEYPLRDEVQLSDIANVQYRLDPSATISRVDGQEGAGMSIRKESDANTVATTLAIQKELQAMEEDPNIPITFYTFFDQGKLIQGALDELKEAALTGGIFAIITLFVFLRSVTMTLLISACIPFTLVISVAAMYLTGGSLNLLSLMGLMIAVGMVVDNAIVVVEGIYARRVEGEAAKPAAINGASEVALAITLSTMTTLAVFLPVILMNQDTDYAFFLGEIGFPISWALGASLIAALAFTPLTTTLLRARQGQSLKEAKWVVWLTSIYQRMLRWILRRRADALLGLVLLSVLTYILPFKAIGCSGDDDGGFGDFSIRYSIPPQFGYYDRIEVIERVEKYVQANQEEWGVDVYTSRLGGSSSTGRTTLYLDSDDPPMSPEDVLEIAKQGLPEIPGVKLWIGWDGNRDNLQFTLTLRGENLEKLELLGDEVVRNLDEIPGILSVDRALEDESTPEIQLLVNRAAARKYGLTATDIGYTVGSALRANPLPEQKIDDKEVDVIARFQYTDRSDLQRLLTFYAWSPSLQQMVPLNQVVDVQMAPSLGSIERTNRQTAYPITINVDQKVEMSQVRHRVNNALVSMNFPTGYGFDPPFDPDDSADEAALYSSLLMSIVLVFLIMGALFESFLLPLSIITTIPMAAFGAYWALYITDTPFDNIAGIGLIILIGVVVNNGIVLIELVTRLRQEGLSRMEALIQGGGRRLRPILMTALTTIFGLLPMAYGGESSSGISYAPMGRVVAGGLTAGTLLTLFFVPLLYALLDDMRTSTVQWVTWARGSGKTSSSAETAK